MVKRVEDVVAEIKKHLASGKIIIGAQRVLKQVRKGKIEKVYVSANASPRTKEDIRRACVTGSISCVDLSQTNEEMGVVCKKPFSISVLGVKA
jgi:large subunit ribosomal protein L30e